jgi:hypothetical protein
MPIPSRPPTVTVSLPGDQRRLRQAILYVAERCQNARYFGAIKLNKILWKADFDSFRARGVPVTGREYRRQKLGPALREMRPVQNEMLRDGAIRMEHRDYGDGIVEKRTIALDRPDTSLFSDQDIGFIDNSIRHYWEMTGTESSDQSHGLAWQTRFNGDPMPYESALLSDRAPGPKQWARLADLIRRREISTQ